MSTSKQTRNLSQVVTHLCIPPEAPRSGKLTLTCLEATLCLVNDVQTTATPHNAIVAVPRLERFKRIFDLHSNRSVRFGVVAFRRRTAPRLEWPGRECLVESVPYPLFGLSRQALRPLVRSNVYVRDKYFVSGTSKAVNLRVRLGALAF